MDEKRLWFEKSRGSLAARNKLIEFYLPLVRAIARNIRNELPIISLEIDDLISFGIPGLIYSVDNFDQSRGLKFITYALPRIRGSILDELRKLDFLPRSARDKADYILRKEEELAQRLGRKPTQTEIAENSNLPVSSIHLYSKQRNSFLFFSDQVNEDDNSIPLSESLPNPNPCSSPEKFVERKEELETLFKAIQNLPPKNKIVIALHYIEGYKFNEIGKMLGVTESRVSQLHSTGIALIKNFFKEKAHNKEI
ncbi:MAG: sigma-70 family RNA polymerase sigma factor [bacterium]